MLECLDTYNRINMEVHLLSRFRFLHTLGWALLISVGIVAVAAGAGRAVINMKAALIDKPDIAIYLLLPEEKISAFLPGHK